MTKNRRSFYNEPQVYDRFAYRLNRDENELVDAAPEPRMRKTHCNSCGIRTHDIRLFLRNSITNKDVYNGICIRCNPESVSTSTWESWIGRNSVVIPEGSDGNVLPLGPAKQLRRRRLPASRVSSPELTPEHFPTGNVNIDESRKSTDAHMEKSKEQAEPAFWNRPDVCERCGIQTHKVKVIRRILITDKDVYKGICIRCNPQAVPDKILAEWKTRHSTTTPCVQSTTGSLYKQLHAHRMCL